MKKVLLGTLAVLTLAACSKDEVIQQNPNDEITFSVVTNKAISRAENGFCNKHTPARFVVSASYTSDGTTFKQYFLNDKFKKVGSAEDGKEYVAFETNRYWPDLSGTNTSVTFYAATDGPKVAAGAEDTWANPISVLPTWQKDGGNTVYTGMEILGYTVENDVAKQRDLLYAVQKVTDNPTGGQQSINFRHALSQIEFMAKNENPNIYVEISQVKVCQVNSKGNFTFPKSTSDKIGAHNGEAGYPADPTDKVGTWANRSTLANYETAAFTAVPLSERKYDGASLKTPTEAADASSLTTEDPSGEWNSNTMYLLPQGFQASTGSATDLTKVWSGSGKPETGAYFLVKTKIQNVAAGDGTRATAEDIYLWGSSSEAKYIAVPIPEDTKWVPGKRYVYTFKFTKTGNGGTDPETGKEVLIPIKLNVTIDDFVDGGNKDVEMNK